MVCINFAHQHLPELALYAKVSFIEFKRRRVDEKSSNVSACKGCQTAEAFVESFDISI